MKSWVNQLFLIIICAALVISTPANAAPSVSPGSDKDAHKLLEEANHLSWLFNWPAAGPLYKRAEELFAEAGEERNAIYAKIGRLRAEGETMSWPELSDLLAQELENPVVRNDSRLHLWCLAAKGYTDLEIDPASSRQAWEQVSEIAKSLGDKAWENRASGELGIIAFLEGDSSRAQSLIAGALLSAMMTGDVGAQVRYMSLIGTGLLELKRNEAAIEYFDRALTIAANTPDAGVPFMAYAGKAEALSLLGRRAEARTLLHDALEQARVLDRRGHEVQLLIMLGKDSLQAGAQQDAVEYLETASAIATKQHFYREIAGATFELAKIYRQSGDLQKAEQHLLAGIEASRQVGDTHFLPRDLTHLAEVRMIQGRLEEAASVYEQALDVVDGMLISSPSAYMKSSLASAMSEIYLGYFALAVQRQDVSKAFEVLERVRGRTAADILRSRPSAKQQRPPAPSPIEKHISRLQVQLMRAKSPQERKELLDALFEAEQRLAPVVNARENWQRGFLGRPVGLREFQANLRADEVLLEYVLTQSAAFYLALTRDQAKLITLPLSGKDTEALVDAYLEEIKSKKLGQEAAAKLYSALLAPLPQDMRKFRLLVVPDGKLHLLPFDSLTGVDRRYLVYSHLVTYAPSATLLYLLRTSRSTAQASLPFLGVGDVAYDEEGTLISQNTGNPPVRSSRGLYDLTGTQFPRLPATRQEVLTSGKIFGEESTVLLGSEATEVAFKSQPLEKFRILHLAVHGVSSSEFPQRAALVLGTDTQANEDGLLQAREIAALPLNADLVILSACDTGAGRLQGAEGIANLVRSFFFAGARSVLASLWSADDIATAALVKQFYAHLAEKKDKASALRQAKIDLLKKYGDEALPYYWAGFTLQGEGASTVPVSQ